jgi:hypothetical protein
VVLISFGLTDNVNYIVSFDHNDKVSVPGGYGRYRVGALGKLAQIEKDPGLIARTFSSMASTYVDYYVFPKDSEVYEDPKVEDQDEPVFVASKLSRQLFSRGFASNAHVLDRIYLAYTLSKYRSQDFVPLHGLAQKSEGGGTDFSEKRFLKKYKGFFYHQSLRDEGKEVKIVYASSYGAAAALSRVIEGQGIRVVDLSQEDTADRESCQVVYSSFGTSKTAWYLGKRFGCQLIKGETEGADIILVLGTQLTEIWK